MAIDTPARLAVLGAGPIGLEAALYARFLGYQVVIYDSGEVAESLRQVADAMMPAPFGDCHTTLGLAAIQAQDQSYQQPNDDETLTYGQWRQRYLLPLAQTDLLCDHLRLRSPVVAVETLESPTTAASEDDLGEAESFRIVSQGDNGSERVELFHGVLDCRGVAAGGGLPGGLAEQPLDTASAANPEPGYFILGSKAYGREHGFAPRIGYDQIRQAFAIIGDRADLDLYKGAARLLR